MNAKLIASAALMSLLCRRHALAQDAAIPKQTVNEQLRARLPEKIRTEGKMISVNNGSFRLTKS